MQRKQEIKQFIARNFLFTEDTGSIQDDASLVASGILDSTGFHELVLFVEDQYRFTVANQEMVPENFETVSAIDAFVARKSAA